MAKRTKGKARESRAPETKGGGHKEAETGNTSRQVKTQTTDQMKNCFVAFTLTDKGELIPHSHQVLAGKEFVNPSHAIQAVQDYLRETPKKDLEPVGAIVLLNLLSF